MSLFAPGTKDLNPKQRACSDCGSETFGWRCPCTTALNYKEGLVLQDITWEFWLAAAAAYEARPCGTSDVTFDFDLGSHYLTAAAAHPPSSILPEHPLGFTMPAHREDRIKNMFNNEWCKNNHITIRIHTPNRFTIGPEWFMKMMNLGFFTDRPE